MRQYSLFMSFPVLLHLVNIIQMQLFPKKKDVPMDSRFKGDCQIIDLSNQNDVDF